MKFIHFCADQLHDPDFSLQREIIQAANTGAYCSSSLINCNTRKYHGLLVVPQPFLDENKYVLLSMLDETILQGATKTSLATHRYPEVFFPEGYKFIENFSYDKVPQWDFKIRDISLKKEVLMLVNEERLVIRYTVVSAGSPFKIQFEPFLAFRKIHSLSKSNIIASRFTERSSNGIKARLYPGFSYLYLQFSKKSEFTAAPDWYYNNEYFQESERGYDCQEDLYCPGKFELSLKKGDQLFFSAGLTEIAPRKIKTVFENEFEKKTPLQSFSHCLENAAEQFLVRSQKGMDVMAGYHWFGKWGRDTFISLPGLTLFNGRQKTCKTIIDTMLKDLKQGLFPNTGAAHDAAYNTADASLWFFWTLQQYSIHTKSIKKIWTEYGPKMRSILENYRKGTLHRIRMMENGLLFAGEPGVAVTWMDTLVDGKPVTPRIGMTVELNALWYNAICFSLEAAGLNDDTEFMNEWKPIASQIEVSFTNTFWSHEKGYLADVVNNRHKDWSLRPNQIIAASLPYSAVSDAIKRSLLEIVKKKLLTPRGLRTLSPDDANYKGVYFGDHKTRDLAYHQGTVWPWLLGPFADAWLKIYGDEGLIFIRSLYENFAPAVLEYGIGTIAEIYDGDAPHKARGAISQAWSVAELLRIRNMISEKQKEYFEKTRKTELIQA